HPCATVFLESRKNAKLHNTYVKGNLEKVDVNNRVHTDFNQHIVRTGRLSSSNPNLQNIPIRTDIGRKVRDAFIAAPGKLLLAVDPVLSTPH
ncbi:hypothetical protein LCGC14_2595460, partial [marine sediment metagenome]